MSTSTLLPERVGNFSLLTSTSIPYANSTLIGKWKSSATGLTVVWADIEGPLVQGYFSVATEIFDDSGRPHTLEHGIFLGSEQYPYKGVLDTLANRLFANGTNAWTDTTNTTYTIGTAGAEGFLSALPVFLDHVLYPTLTSSGFTTEVYALNGKGEDSGVVFSEMQGRENGSGDLMELRLQRSLYGKENAMRSETGGLMSALRELTIEQIREYHASSYVPSNLTLIVLGRSLSPHALLSTLSRTVEPSILSHPSHPPPPRPFVETSTATHPPSIPENRTEKVEFPEKDESVGEVMVSWIGMGLGDWKEQLAAEVLGVYLTESAVSPLSKVFIEIEEPLCTDITFSSSTSNPIVLTTYLSSVPSSHLSTLPSLFLSTLSSLSSSLDMTRMSSILHRQKLQLLDSVETNASDVVSDVVLTDFLFGEKEGGDWKKGLWSDLKYYEELEKWGKGEWEAVFKKYYVGNPAINIIGTPSAALADKLEASDKARIAANVEKNGPEGLAKLADKIKAAQKENDKPIPEEIIKKFEVPDVGGIGWIEVESARSEGGAGREKEKKGKVQEWVDKDAKGESNWFIQFDHIHSAFLELTIHFHSFSPSPSIRALLPIYLDSFFSLPITRSTGEKLSYEQVVEQLDKEMLSYSFQINDPMQETIALRMKCENDKEGQGYVKAVEWLKDLVWGSEFDLERLKISASKALQNIPGEKRNGSRVAHDTYCEMVSGDKSAGLSMNLLTRAEFLPKFIERIKNDPEGVKKDFEEFRQALTNPKAMRISVKGDILSLEKPTSTWVEKFKPIEKFDKSELVPVVLSHNVLGSLGKKPAKKITVFGVSSIESCFGYHVAKGPEGWSHPDQPALTVARSYLNAMEGALWTHIRGAGLAYGADISQDSESGLIYYRIFKSPDSHAAFAAAKVLVDSLVSGKIEIPELMLESAKSSLAYNTAARESTMSDAASASFANQVLRGLPASHGRDALARTKNVTVADVQRVIAKWIQPIFDPATSMGGVAAGTAKMESIAVAFEKIGYEVERRTFGDADEDDSEEGSDGGSEE